MDTDYFLVFLITFFVYSFTARFVFILFALFVDKFILEIVDLEQETTEKGILLKRFFQIIYFLSIFFITRHFI